jgi:PDZ domain
MSRHRCCCAILFTLPLCWPTVAQAQPMRSPELSALETVQPGVEPGYLGMVADDRSENGRGVRVKDVDPDSPAAKAGLQPDDLITAINGQAIQSDEAFGGLLRPLQAGAKVDFKIDRQGTAQNIEVTLGRRPPPDQRRFQNFGRLPEAPADQPGDAAAAQSSPGRYSSEPSMPTPPQPSATPSSAAQMPPPSLGPGSLPRPLLGVRTLAVTQQDQMRLGLPSAAGAHVLGRNPGSPAEKANIPLDSVITALNGAPVATPNDLTAMLARAGAGSEVELTYYYNGAPTQTKVTLGFPGASRDLGRGPPQGTTQSSLPPSNSASNWPPPNPMPLGNQSRSMGAMPPQSATQSSPADTQRIEALERRVQQLEQRIQELENRPQRGT